MNGTPPEAKLRCAIALMCADAVVYTDPWTSAAKRAVVNVLARLASDAPLSVDDERSLTSFLLAAGCRLNPGYGRRAFTASEPASGSCSSTRTTP